MTPSYFVAVSGVLAVVLWFINFNATIKQEYLLEAMVEAINGGPHVNVPGMCHVHVSPSLSPPHAHSMCHVSCVACRRGDTHC